MRIGNRACKLPVTQLMCSLSIISLKVPIRLVTQHLNVSPTSKSQNPKLVANVNCFEGRRQWNGGLNKRGVFSMRSLRIISVLGHDHSCRRDVVY